MMFRKTIFAVIGLLTLAVGANANLLLTGAGSKGSAGGGGGSLPLDSLSTAPTSAVSLHKLKTSWAGSAINVRRDGASPGTSDIGFSGNDLNSTALLSYCAAVNCFVVTAYDQTGNGRDYTQATTTKQPQIVTAGSLTTTVNSKASMLFVSGSITALQLTGAGTLASVVSSTAYTIMGSARPTAGISVASANAGHLFVDTGASDGGYIEHGAFHATLGWEFEHFDSAGHTVNVAATYPGTHVSFSKLSGTTLSAALDGGTPATGTVSGAVSNLTFKPTLGTNYLNTGAMDGSISTVITWNAAISSADANAVGSYEATYAGTSWTSIP